MSNSLIRKAKKNREQIITRGLEAAVVTLMLVLFAAVVYPMLPGL